MKKMKSVIQHSSFSRIISTKWDLGEKYYLVEEDDIINPRKSQFKWVKEKDVIDLKQRDKYEEKVKKRKKDIDDYQLYKYLGVIWQGFIKMKEENVFNFKFSLVKNNRNFMKYTLVHHIFENSFFNFKDLRYISYHDFSTWFNKEYVRKNHITVEVSPVDHLFSFKQSRQLRKFLEKKENILYTKSEKIIVGHTTCQLNASILINGEREKILLRANSKVEGFLGVITWEIDHKPS